MVRLLLAIALNCVAFPASSAEPPLAAIADGPPFQASFIGSKREPWTLSFAEYDRTREIVAPDLVLWGDFVDPAAGIRVLLADGSLLVLETAQIKNERILGTSPLVGDVDLPLESVAGIVLRPPVDRATGDQWSARIASLAGQTDRVLMDNGDELTGTVLQLEGKALALQSDGKSVDVDTAGIASLIFNPTLLRKPRADGLRMVVGLSDGSRLLTTALEADKETARLKLLGGAELKTATQSIVALQPLGGRAVYLSDLKPASYKHLPYLQLSWPYHADRSVLDRQLRVLGKLYTKGLGMHSPSRITYELGGAYRRFETEVAIDAEAGRGGSAVFRVFTDNGDGTWKQRATSQTVRGGEPPAPLSVDLEGAKRLSLLVEFADHGDELDHADWLNARLLR